MTETSTPATTSDQPSSPANGDAGDSDLGIGSSAPVDSVAADRAANAGLFHARVAVPQTPEPSPDGQRLAYLLDDAGGQTRLWLSPVDGGDPQPVELPVVPVVERDPDTGRPLRGPQWSPDGTMLALAGRDAAMDRTAIWLVPVPAIAGTADVAASPGELADDVAPAVDDDGTAGERPSGDEPPRPEDAAAPVDAAPDNASVMSGDTIANGAPDTDLDIEEDPLAADIAAREPRRLTAGDAPERSPRWSPDGRTIAFVQTRDRRDAIALAPPATGGPAPVELLTWSARDDREPAWSRDGKFLAFTRQRPDGPEHADIFVFVVATGELKDLTGEKASAIRHSLEWVPGRNLVAYVTREVEWLSISVINADNRAGWTVTRETGDKTEPRFAPAEARMLYVRTEGFATVCCERGLHASGSVALDPGEGAVYSPRWLGDKRVIYGFSAPQRPFGFLVQDNTADAERLGVPVPDAPSTVGATLRQPVPFEFEVGEDEQFSGLLYRAEGTVGPAPGVVYLADGPLATRYGSFRPEEQALASTGMTALAPVLHGATGFGAGVEDDLAEYADGELEMTDIAAAGRALGESSGVDEDKLALVGHGYGGTLALLTAGARPGIFAAVVAIDPIADWAVELEGADAPWRTWVSRQYGLPRTSPDRYVLRTPETFAAVIDVPLLLVSTASAPEHRRRQLDGLTRYLDESGVAYERIEVGEEPVAATLHDLAHRLAARFRTGAAPTSEPDATDDDPETDDTPS